MAQATKSFKIGEYAVGGIIKVMITGKVIQIQALDYNSKEVVQQGTVTTELRSAERQITDFLNDLTSSYYAGKIMDWITNKVDLKSAW